MPAPNTRLVCLSLASLSLLAATLPARVDATAANTGTPQGTAYRLDDGTVAYREMHLLYERAGMPMRLVLYRCANGDAFARKIVVERAGAVTPDFDFVDARSGYREGVRSTGEGRQVYWQESSADTEKQKILHIPADAVIDAGFDAMVRAHWPRLGGQDGINARFLLPSALSFLKVRIQRSTAKPLAGVTRLRMTLDTWYGFAAPDTDLDYRTSDQRLLRFKGIGNIRDGRGRNQAVRIEFPGGLQGKLASSSEVEAARRLPLTGHCEA